MAATIDAASGQPGARQATDRAKDREALSSTLEGGRQTSNRWIAISCSRRLPGPECVAFALTALPACRLLRGVRSSWFAGAAAPEPHCSA